MASVYAWIGPDHGAVNWWQMSIRGVIIFIYGIALLRIAGRRAFGQQSSLDIMLSVLIGSNLSRAATAGAPFFPTMAGTAALVALYWISIQLAQRWDFFGTVLKGGRTVLIRDGRTDPKAMRQTGVSHLDLHEAIRTSRLEHVEQVQLASLERGGQISIVPRKD